MEDIPEDVKQQYKLSEKVMHNGWLYVEIRKGVYDLPQSGLLAQEFLEKRLVANVYTQNKLAPGLWKHHTWQIEFCLIVDDVGVKYVGKRTCRTFEGHIRTKLQDLNGLEWNKTHQAHLRLRLWQTRSIPANARICAESINNILASTTKKITISTIPLHFTDNNLWNQKMPCFLSTRRLQSSSRS